MIRDQKDDKMRKLKRSLTCIIASILMAICLFSSSMYVGAASTDIYEDTIVLMENTEGIYEKVNPNSRTGIRVSAKEGGQIYEGDVNNLFMRIDDNHFMKAEELSIDAQSYSQFEAVAENKGLSDQLKSDINRIMVKVQNGEIELTEPLAVYVPEPIYTENNARSITSSTKTYTGYAGMKYYQELLDFKANSLEFNVTMPSARWKQYCNQVFEAAVTTTASAGLDAITGRTWTLLSVFTQSTSDSISTTKAIKHTAKLFENKYIKYTHVVLDGQYYAGSVIEYTYNYFFRNFINVDGSDFYSNGDTEKQTAKAKGYDKADEYAYQNYVSSPYINSITRYTYKNKTAGVNTYVNSMF